MKNIKEVQDYVKKIQIHKKFYVSIGKFNLLEEDWISFKDNLRHTKTNLTKIKSSPNTTLGLAIYDLRTYKLILNKRFKTPSKKFKHLIKQYA